MIIQQKQCAENDIVPGKKSYKYSGGCQQISGQEKTGFVVRIGDVMVKCFCSKLTTGDMAKKSSSPWSISLNAIVWLPASFDEE
jgi:hypothetical protein